MAYILVATFALLIPLLRILPRIVCFYTHTGIYIRLIIDSAVEIPRANVPRIAKQQAILGVEEELDWSSVPRHRVWYALPYIDSTTSLSLSLERALGQK
jgi:hypothetical protein